MEKPSYRGFELVLAQEGSIWWAGFKKNPRIVCAKTKEEALAGLKKRIDAFPPAVIHAYEKHGKQMRELEGL